MSIKAATESCANATLRPPSFELYDSPIVIIKDKLIALINPYTTPSNDFIFEISNKLYRQKKPKNIKSFKELISFVSDRPGHDKRYAIDSSKITSELGWTPNETFETGLMKTVKWYLANSNWWERVLNGKYKLDRIGEIN